MNGLKASPGGGLSSTLRVMPTLQLPGASKCDVNNYDKCEDEEDDSLEGFSVRDDDECVNLLLEEEIVVSDAVEPNNANPNDHHDDDEKIQKFTRMDRDVCTFFDQYLPHHPASPQSSKPLLQPIAVLQSRYNTLQYQRDKQAQQKSIKGWFRDVSWGKKSNDSWWTSEIVIPSDDIAESWGLNSTIHRSGQLQLTRSEMETLLKRRNNNSDVGNSKGEDLLLDLCGEFKITSTNMIQFKLKKGARKSSALNLLLAIDLGDLLPKVVDDCDSTENGQPSVMNAAIATKDGILISNNNTDRVDVVLPKDRFQLESIKYYGAVQHPDGDFLSPDNPCMVQCIVSVADIECNDANLSMLEMKTDFHQDEHDSLKAALEMLRPALVGRGATANDINNLFSSMIESKPNIGYEITIPKWASAMIRSKLFLYELQFSFCKEGSGGEDVYFTPLSEAMGLDAYATTRIGILCGSDLYEGRTNDHDQFEKMLCADFMPASSLCNNVDGSSTGKIRVRMCRRTEATLPEMERQLQMASPAIDLDNGEDPTTLAKCFNIILHDHGRSYGLGPKLDWGELLERLGEDTPKPGDRRTYMFLPLRSSTSTPDLEIDWRVVWDVVHHETTCVLSHSGAGVRLPTSLFKRISLGLSLGTSLSCAMAICPSMARCYAGWDHHSLLRNDWILTALLAILCAFGLWTSISTCKTIPTSLLRNRFLSQPVGFGGRMFIAKDQGSASIFSLMPLLWHILKKILRELYTDTSLSNAKYYKHLWQWYIRRHPMEPLIPAQLFKGLSYPHHELSLFHQIYGKPFLIPTTKPSPHNGISNLLADRGLLVPELTHTLPMPRDMLYLCQHASNFMLKLERAYTLNIAASRIREVQHNTGKLFGYTTVSDDNISPIFDKATSICNRLTNEDHVLREHERLESLGDSTLLFFIVLNLFVKQSSSDTEYVLDLFEQVIVLQGMNEVLFKAAMRVGLHRLVHAGNVPSTKLWRSMYKTTTNEPLAAHTQTMELAKKQLSDIVESFLGAAYLADPSGYMAVGFLNEIGSCLPNVEGVADPTTSWFAGEGTCLTEGYPLNANSGWAAELTKIEDILQRKHGIISTLQTKAAEICHLLSKQANCQDRMKIFRLDPTASLLLHCALFDDSLDEEYNSETRGLESFANLRDKIFHVGNAALQLSIISEIYHLYPTNTSGDIHLMKVALMSHDSLAYIFVKNGLHECLFDTNADAHILMQGYMEESDLLGAKVWANNDGWMIPGGLDEFHRRVQQYYGDGMCKKLACPQYMGLAAGRLWGHGQKLEGKASEDLQFSMKCIVGALTLTFGLRDAWDMLRPLFLELTLMSPEELRTSYKGVSDLTSNYKKGKK